MCYTGTGSGRRESGSGTAGEGKVVGGQKAGWSTGQARVNDGGWDAENLASIMWSSLARPGWGMVSKMGTTGAAELVNPLFPIDKVLRGKALSLTETVW